MRNTERTSERPKTAYELRCTGLSWPAIADRVGYAGGTSARDSVYSWCTTHALTQPEVALLKRPAGPLPIPPEHCRLLDEAVRYVAEYLDVPPSALIEGRTRTPDFTLGRYLVFYSLCQYGLNPAEISRLTDRNHSAIIYGLDSLQRHVDRKDRLAAFAASLPVSLRAWGTYSLIDTLKAVLTTLPSADRAHVLCYVTGDLLGHRAPPWEKMERYAGHELLMARHDIATQVHTVLGYFKEDGAAGALADQVRKHTRRSA